MKRWREALDELRRDFVDEARRLARLVFAEHPAPRRAGQHEALPRPRHADVAEPPFFLELLLVVARARVRKQAFFEPGQDDRRKLEALRAVQRHQPDARVARALLLRRRRTGATAGRRTRSARAPARGSRTRARPTRAPRGSRCAPRVLGAILAQVLEIAAPVEHLADGDRHRILARDLGQA